MTASRLADYLDHMLEAAMQVCTYVEGLSKEEFLQDKRTQQAVILNLILIGEEVSKVLRDDETFTHQHPEVPWRSMKGMRNRIAHGYYEINLDTVWDTTQTALPSLIAQLPSVLQSAQSRG